MTKLYEQYRGEIVPKLMEQFSYGSVMEVPRLEKITLNMGLGEAIGDRKIIEAATGDMGLISGQKPVVTVARKSVAGFKIRDGYPIGCKVTLRRARMYEFFERLVAIAIPRQRDFAACPEVARRSGQLRHGFSEQIVFPEIDYDKVDTLRGLDICITTTAKNDEEGRALLAAFNFLSYGGQA